MPFLPSGLREHIPESGPSSGAREPWPSVSGGAGSGPLPRAGAVRSLRLRLGPADRDVLWLYLVARLAVWITAYCARWLFPANSGSRDPGPLLAPFQQWDWGYYLRIARDGYFPGQGVLPHSSLDHREAFLPGFPLVLRAVHTAVPSWTAAGLLVSFVAGAVAVLSLSRIARLQVHGQEAGRRAVLFLLVSPCAVFLAAGYTEALFLALALPAWLAAQRYNWPLAAALTALAATVRVNGLFLAAAIALHFVLTARTGRHWRQLPWLFLPAVPVALHSGYLHARTGDWLAWKHAEEHGWNRTFHAPWEAWANTWHAAFAHTQTTGYAFMFQAELLAMLAGLLLMGLLVRQRRWAELLYIGLTLWALGTSYWYMSIPRSTLLWWPLWITMAGWSLRRPWFRTAWLGLAAPVTTVFALTFLSGRWAG
ncbi:mannosyltransferase family protein [Streptomyces sp. NBC_00859]|uniref:mannosyltransferase family protein n=1 Tax=Streptomyces sp. NBC_00859 TaxID=2903682 RepID=UPI003867328D|nr:mannosyltransferase family protein [Streptomyces sp. NBC_00859]